MKLLKRTGIGILTALTAVLCLLGIKNEYARLLPVSTYGMQAVIRQKEIDHLFIGSSMFRQGLSIEVLEDQLPGSSFILSYNGNQPAFMAMELQYLLEQGVKIQNLYIDLYPYTAAADPWISDTKLLLDTDLDFKWKTWRLMRDYSDGGLLDFYELFVTANNEQLLTYPIHNRLVSPQFRNGGNLLTPPGQTKEHLDSLGLLGPRDGLNPIQKAGYEELIRLAKEQGITVWFLETPKYERIYEDPDYQRLYGQCVQAAEELLQEAGAEEQRLILSQDLGFDSKDAAGFQDLIHLSAAGRTSYTRKLCERLEAYASW